MRRQIQSKEQRQGRGVRQGNQNPEMQILRYAVQGSFDTYSWQTVERKARFINQIMRGRLDMREIEDIGENTLSFAEVKALASGDPLILEKSKIDAEVTRLARLERAWQRNQQMVRHTSAGAADRARALDRQIQAVEAAIERRQDTRGERFHMTVDGRHVATRAGAAQLLAARLTELPYGQRVRLGELGGLPIDAEIRVGRNGRPLVELTLHGVPAEAATLERGRLAESGLSLVRQLEHRIDQLPALASRLQDHRDQALREAATAREQLARPFKYAEQLADARHKQERIDDQIGQRHRQAHQPQPPAASDPVEPEAAEALRLLRPTQARPVEEALHASPATAAARPHPPRDTSHGVRPRR